jgi:hypothetical protein
MKDHYLPGTQGAVVLDILKCTYLRHKYHVRLMLMDGRTVIIQITRRSMKLLVGQVVDAYVSDQPVSPNSKVLKGKIYEED